MLQLGKENEYGRDMVRPSAPFFMLRRRSRLQALAGQVPDLVEAAVPHSHDKNLSIRGFANILDVYNRAASDDTGFALRCDRSDETDANLPRSPGRGYVRSGDEQAGRMSGAEYHGRVRSDQLPVQRQDGDSDGEQDGVQTMHYRRRGL